MIESNKWTLRDEEWKSLNIKRKLRDFGLKNWKCIKLKEPWNLLKERLLNRKKEERETSSNKRRLNCSLNMAIFLKNIIQKHLLNMVLALSNLKILTCLKCCLLHITSLLRILKQSLFQDRKGNPLMGFQESLGWLLGEQWSVLKCLQRYVDWSW